MKNEDDRARILVVEDLHEVQVLLRYLLRSRFDLEVASSVDEALHRAAQRPFDLFLLDINLGEQRTGIDLLEALRQMPACRTTPAVACTAYALHGDRERFLASGFDEHVGKPFTRHRLFEIIDAVLAGAGASPEGRTYDLQKVAA